MALAPSGEEEVPRPHSAKSLTPAVMIGRRRKFGRVTVNASQGALRGGMKRVGPKP